MTDDRPPPPDDGAAIGTLGWSAGETRPPPALVTGSHLETMDVFFGIDGTTYRLDADGRWVPDDPTG